MFYWFRKILKGIIKFKKVVYKHIYIMILFWYIYGKAIKIFIIVW